MSLSAFLCRLKIINCFLEEKEEEEEEEEEGGGGKFICTLRKYIELFKPEP